MQYLDELLKINVKNYRLKSNQNFKIRFLRKKILKRPGKEHMIKKKKRESVKRERKNRKPVII